ncbi:MAG: FAD-dependent oxidoreductase [Candidatus Harrisonbacteria bacterium CG10_big_fil_rev_8_21_14_0_10_49_15]|uniref:FAD-dependent oxidoreductase n=1 Tax=Candidatus Harrisonbacteria bacterium CG10_big_fil_rev_8_21_14_0_10_49_15 TaxID=1974587 RepID=A0A2H0UNZ9_9BACT|nr:MAG: FAD-dependent oxidoreductase [Candidatus Harrisonbacteria bacterium CG10_big_fil_rev_8_21_14_0_10_49_15]
MTATSIAPLPTTARPTKVVVIGGGVTGTITAWELARMGHQVTLLEARQVGSGSSSRSAACIRQQFSTPSTVRGMRYSVQFYDQWHALMGGAESPIRHNGYLFLKDYTADPEAVQATVAMQQEAGLTDVTWLTKEELDEQFPYIESTGLQGATWCPTDGFLFPHIVYNDSAEAARRNGVQVVQGAEVVEANHSNGRVASVITRDGNVFDGDIFVNAANAWAPRLSGICGGFALDIQTRRRYLYFMEGLRDESMGLAPDDVRNLPMTITPRGAYCRPESTHQLMMGWLHFTKPVEADFDDQDRIEPGFGHNAFSGYGMGLHKELSAFVPAVADMGNIHAVTAGYYADTADHNPLIGFDPIVANLLHVAGFSGHGLMHAPFSARIVACLIEAGHNIASINLPDLGSVDLKPYEVDREPARGEAMVI